MRLLKTVESKVKVRFPDCDPFNHLNNSKYIDYTINAREDHLLNSYGFDIYKIAQEQGISWVVGQSQVAYLAPALLMESITIETKLLLATKRTLQMEGIIYNDTKTQIKAVLWIKLVHFDLKAKQSKAHSDDFMVFFKQIENQITGGLNFDQRVASLKKQ